MDDKMKEIEERYKNPDYVPDLMTTDEVESDIKYLLSRIEELEEKQKWIDEVARPDHPDDERPWCAAYLDCRERIKELEKKIELAEATRDDALAYAKGYKEKIKELEEQ